MPRLARTAPVLQERQGNGKWSVYFVMPTKYGVETLPTPNDVRLKIVSIPARKVAAIRFSGSPSEEILKAHPPWTLPCFRRNEVWFNLSE